MQLPDDAIGISDILAWRECPRRMSFSMRRHTPAGEPPEATTVNTAFGSATHDMLEFVGNNDAFDDEAVQYAFDKWARWLEPDDLPRLRENLKVYRERDYLGVRTVAVEGEYRVPLFTDDSGRTFYFRCKIDRLYQSLHDESVFISIDYKTSRWPKTEEEVHNDVQQWAYNWAIHEVFPECATLVQHYDQLRYGSIPTRKSDEQRAQMKEWIVRHVKAIIKDEDYGEDGLLQPKLNDWCAYCPLAESCKVVDDVTDWTFAVIEAMGADDIEATAIDKYAAKLEDVGRAKKLLERYETSVRGAVQQLPQGHRERLGYGIVERRVDHFPVPALRLAYDVLGDRLFEAVTLSKTAVGRVDDPKVRDFLLGLAERKVGSTYIKKKGAKSGA